MSRETASAQRPVALLHRAGEEGALERGRRAAVTAEDQHPRGLAVEAVRHLPAVADAQALAHQRRQRVPVVAGRRVHRQTGGLVDHQQLGVAVQLAVVHDHARLTRRRPLDDQRLADVHPLTRPQQQFAGVGPPDPPGRHDLLDPRARQPDDAGGQEAVEAKPVAGAVHDQRDVDELAGLRLHVAVFRAHGRML
jgi:hypothetical protein